MSSFVDSALSFAHIRPAYYKSLAVILAGLYLYIFHIMDHIQSPTLKSFHYACLKRCESDACRAVAEHGRDSNYYLDAMKSAHIDNSDCAYTTWEMTHFIMHAFIGFFFNIQISTVFSVAFEIFEHYAYNCGSFLDLVHNLMGCLVGIALRHQLVAL